MTGKRPETNDDPLEASAETPLDPWMLSLVREAIDVDEVSIPREMMWARLQHQRRAAAGDAEKRAAIVDAPMHRPPVRRQTTWVVRVAGIAALLVGGIGVGRYLLPATGPSQYQTALADSQRRADSIMALGYGPEALAAMPPSSDPARIAMDEHLARTVALLTTVRDEDPELGPGADISGWARDLLGTTRLLIDEPQLDDERTRRLLQDLELVLAQIVQVRGSAPETRRAPNETMRETNLLPRMRAVVSASWIGDETTLGGGL